MVQSQKHSINRHRRTTHATPAPFGMEPPMEVLDLCTNFHFFENGGIKWRSRISEKFSLLLDIAINSRFFRCFENSSQLLS